jgi:hypothetical protein
MNWSNQSGGGGPWGPRKPNPWGSGPTGGGNGQGPDMEDVVRRSHTPYTPSPLHARANSTRPPQKQFPSSSPTRPGPFKSNFSADQLG